MSVYIKNSNPLEVNLTENTIGIAKDASLQTINDTISALNNNNVLNLWVNKALPQTVGSDLVFYSTSYGNPNAKDIFIYGNSSDDVYLTLQVSPDSIKWYRTQYQVNVSAGTDFGFCLKCPAQFRLLASNSVANISAYASYC